METRSCPFPPSSRALRFLRISSQHSSGRMRSWWPPSGVDDIAGRARIVGGISTRGDGFLLVLIHQLLPFHLHSSYITSSFFFLEKNLLYHSTSSPIFFSFSVSPPHLPTFSLNPSCGGLASLCRANVTWALDISDSRGYPPPPPHTLLIVVHVLSGDEVVQRMKCLSLNGVQTQLKLFSWSPI